MPTQTNVVSIHNARIKKRQQLKTMQSDQAVTPVINDYPVGTWVHYCDKIELSVHMSPGEKCPLCDMSEPNGAA